jgi:aminopeptidase-like protein
LIDRRAAEVNMRAVMEEIFPICRSITGNGVRSTLAIVGRALPMTIHEVPTGTRVLDWIVPKEWNVVDAYVADASGSRVIDFRRSNLHLLNYSTPVHTRVTRAQLEEHLHSRPDRPELVPYRTSYYEETWGFCLSDHERRALPDGDYDVVVDSTLTDGALTYGEVLLPGADREPEVLLTTHVCHPSLANDNCSGIALLTELGRLLASESRRLSYRLLFIPGTIGSITWLAQNESRTRRIAHGIVLTGVGDSGPLTWKRSRRADTVIDRAAEHVLKASGASFEVRDFSPYGYDERQFCSPGFDLPVGRLSRTPHGEYPEYHTSGDNLGFVDDRCLRESLEAVAAMLDVLEGNATYMNTQPKGEPQLGRRGLYRAVGGAMDHRSVEMAMLWVLNQSDGTRSLLEIAERSNLPFTAVRDAATSLVAHDLLVEVSPAD